MPKQFTPEFKRDVVTVARRGDPTYAEVAADLDSALAGLTSKQRVVGSGQTPSAPR